MTGSADEHESDATAGLRPEPAWSSAMGRSRIAAPQADSLVDPVLDRLLVAERIARYGWAYDERQREALGGCFVDDGVWEGSVMGSPIGPFSGRDAITEYLAGFWREQADQRRHIFTNVVTEELADTSAVAHAYLLLTASRDATMTAVTVGPYRFDLVKRGGVWLIQRLSAGFDVPF